MQNNWSRNAAGGASCRGDAAIERRHVVAAADASAGAVQEGSAPQSALPCWQPDTADSFTAARWLRLRRCQRQCSARAKAALADHAIGRSHVRLRAVTSEPIGQKKRSHMWMPALVRHDARLEGRARGRGSCVPTAARRQRVKKTRPGSRPLLAPRCRTRMPSRRAHFTPAESDPRQRQ